MWAGWGELIVSPDLHMLSLMYFEASRKRDVGSPEQAGAMTLVCGADARRYGSQGAGHLGHGGAPERRGEAQESKARARRVRLPGTPEGTARRRGERTE